MSIQPLNAPKGTRDLFGPEGDAFTRLEETARRVFRLYSFSEVRTPLFESVDLFSRSLGATSDVVEKEMFTFQDRGERTFALRPEGTAGVVRFFIEHNLAMTAGGTQRLFYMGPMFRGERPQAGRYRQFWQIGSEYLGASDAAADADTVLMVSKIFQDFGLTNFTIQVNSLGCKECRPVYRKALLAYLQEHESVLSEESKKRMNTNPLRVLDSKEDGPKLKNPPVMKDFLCSACREHHEQFLFLIKMGSAKIEENSSLVRGLDYYTRSVFEFVSPDLGAQSALAAGGRYDELVHLLGGSATPGVGFALGMDRVVQAWMKKNGSEKIQNNDFKKVMVIPMIDEALLVSFDLAHSLRSAGVAVAPLMPKKKLKNQLSLAVEMGANWAILIGEDELKTKEATIKNLATREQVKVPLDKVIENLK